jgi:hypothetical protein
MTNEANLIRNARAASAARVKAAKQRAAKANVGTLPAARVPRALERDRADAYAAFVVATAKAATAARREKS